MRINFARHARITRLSALALTAFFIMQLLEPHWAAASDNSLPLEQISLSYGKVTFSYGQTLRLNLTYFTMDIPSQPMPAIRASAQLRDTSGNTIYVSSAGGGVWKTIDAGGSIYFEVSRDELALTGDARTGAVAVVPELIVEVPAGARPDVPTSLEITDNLTGKVVLRDGRSVMSQQPANTDYSAIVFVGGWGSSIYSIARSETLTVNVTNPLPLTLANQPVAAIDYFVKIKGVEGESSNVRTGKIKPGRTIVAKFGSDQLPNAGGSPTGSVRFIVEIGYSLQLTPDQMAALGSQVPIIPIMELEEFANGAIQTTRIDSYYGTGIYKSVDGGRSW